MDARFDTSRDPRFKKVPQSVRRIKVDKRFAHMFNDKNFVETPKVDSRGQRMRRDSVKNKLREFYELAADDDDSLKENKANKQAVAQAERGNTSRKVARRKKASLASKQDEEQAPDLTDEDDDQETDVDEEAQPADQDSSAESQEESSESEDEKDALEGDGLVWENEENVPQGDATSRLAIMGCDWDHTSASDLLVMLRTYLNSKDFRRGSGAMRTGTVDKVAIYPSQYGLEQTAKESESGPTGIVDSGVDDQEDDSVKQAKVNEAMRKYQLQRTKYYYAVAFCDSTETAARLYDQLDGLDAESICPATLDLRFVPEDLDFPHAPREEASKTPNKYQGPAAHNSALGHTKVQCSWDEAPAHRKRDLMKKRFTPQELEQMDLDDYLASSSGEDDDKAGAAELKKLARGMAGSDEGSDDDFFKHSDEDDDGKDVEGNMEATFNLSTEKLGDELADRVEEEQNIAKGSRIRKLADAKPKSTWQQYLDKRKEKRKERKLKAKEERQKRREGGAGEEKDDAAEDGEAAAGDLELLADGEEDDERGFNVRGRQRTAAKRAAKESTQDSNFKVDVNDPRIAGVFATGDFEIDPTNPEFRPTAGMQAVLKKKRERKPKAVAPQPTSAEVRKPEPSISAPEPLRPASLGGANAGGIQLFARRKPQADAPTEAGAQSSAERSNARHVETSGPMSKKRRHADASQDASVVQDVPAASRKKKRRKDSA
mmetsp:Transcript_53991/g.85938  ORF Transcript_53991/g.85938 Transcript_53991/m.85938 type:complete len:716 (-) Transcript_53991:8-2155(-)